MTPEYFRTQMKFINEDFGTADYTPNKVRMIWEFCHDLPNESFRNIVRNFIATRPAKYPPLPTHFQEEAIAQRKLLRRDGPRLESAQGESTTDLQPSTGGLEAFFKKLGVRSALEAMNRMKTPPDQE